MAGSITFLGHVSVDTVQNINGSNIQPGGAALHAASAARTLVEDIVLASVVGKDYRFIDDVKSFAKRKVKVVSAPSTKFSIRYDEQWEAHYLQEEYGAGKKISFETLPREELKPDSAIHISPLPPLRVKRIVSRIREMSPETRISVNTWIGYMKTGRDRRALRELASEVDSFIVNDSEVKVLAEADSLSVAFRMFEAKTLVMTLGELGAIVRVGRGEVQMVPALWFPIEKIVDTTGAGDTWCGAFLAAYQLTKDFAKSVTAASVISSIKCTGWGSSKLSNLRFKNVDSIAEYVIGLREGKMQKSISEYS